MVVSKEGRTVELTGCEKVVLKVGSPAVEMAVEMAVELAALLEVGLVYSMAVT